MDAMRPKQQWQLWLDEFQAKHGRPLRVLHIGNIANVAYNNCKLQRDAGIHADLLVYDFYHIMGSPEWEDATFEHPPGNDFFPDWWSMPTYHFARPAWFFQGPPLAALSAVAGWVSNHPAAAEIRRKLEIERWVACSPSTAAAACKKTRTFLQRSIADYFDQYIATEAVDHSLNQEAVKEDFRLLFPSDPREITAPDVLCFTAYLRQWHAVMRQYDVIQAYATEPVMPYVAGYRPYLALEIGTVRDLPFQDDALGKLLSLAYARAQRVFVTNSDVLPQLDQIGVPPEHQVYLPHPFNSEKMRSFLRSATSRPRAVPSFIHPPRQQWREGIASMRKGNDLVFKAARLLKDRGFTFDLRVIDWGREADLSKALVAELEIGDSVTWLQTLRKEQLWQEYIDSVAVIDQFVLPALGNVGLEALLLGKPLITTLDEPTCDRFFGEAPPVLNANTPEQIADHMAALLDNSDYREDVGDRAMRWFDQRHDVHVIISKQVDAYRSVLNKGK